MPISATDILDWLETPIAILQGDDLAWVYSNKAMLNLRKILDKDDARAILSPDDIEKPLLRVHKRGHFRVATEHSLNGSKNAIYWHLRQISDGNFLLEGIDDSRAHERDSIINTYTQMIEEKNQIAEAERLRAEKLLLNILPQRIVDELNSTGQSRPELYKSVSVMFLDFAGFTAMSVSRNPDALFTELNEIFTAFDNIMEQQGCERIKTIGDAYLAVSGMPIVCADHAVRLVNSATQILSYLRLRNSHKESQWQARIGIHSGEAIGGIVGTKKYIFDVFGDAINTASRMESHSPVDAINISEATYNLVCNHFLCEARPAIEVKGKGIMKMYLIK